MICKVDFPIFKYYPDLIYLDAGATSQIPDKIIKAQVDWYQKYHANVHRGQYQLSVWATNEYETARSIIANHFGVGTKETIFTKSTTEGINHIARSYKKYLNTGDTIVISELEHHSNILPWREIAKEKAVKLKILKVKDGRVDLENAKLSINNRTKIVSIAHISNVFGTIQPVTEIAKIAHQFRAIVIVDGAQAVAHLRVKPWDLGADAYVFSGHKVYGPTGIGVAFIKESLGQKLDHFLLGGEMVESVSKDKYQLKSPPWRFEAGTPNPAGAVALARSIELLDQDFESHQRKLNDIKKNMYEALVKVGTIIYSPKDYDIPLISFNLKGINSDELALALDNCQIALRSGFLCAQPLVTKLSLDGVVRASAGLWNKPEDIENLKKSLLKIKNRPN